jgi:hypothetical protein
MSFLSHNARMTASKGNANSSKYPIFSSKAYESNTQGKARVQGAFPGAIIKKEQDSSSNDDPWYDITLKYHIGEENLYEPDKTTLVAHVEIPQKLKDYKLWLGGRKSRRGKRGSRTSRRRSRRARK